LFHIKSEEHPPIFKFVKQSRLRISPKITANSQEERVSAVKKLIASKLGLTHVPLLRMHESEINRPDDFEENYSIQRALRQRHISPKAIAEIMDPSVRVLTKIEHDFKTKHSEIQSEMNNELANLKDQIIDKFLVDDQLAQDTNRYFTTMNTAIQGKADSHDVESLLKKFDDADIKIPAAKIKTHFAIWKDLTNKVHDSHEKLTHDGSKKADALQADYSKNYFQLFSITCLFERFLSIVVDIDQMEEGKLKLTSMFDSFAEEINKFLINKKFSFTENGGFLVTCGKRVIELSDLSSGEKHIIAILGRVALSPIEGSVFIADEPELSLHLEWQRMIMQSR